MYFDRSAVLLSVFMMTSFLWYGEFSVGVVDNNFLRRAHNKTVRSTFCMVDRSSLASVRQRYRGDSGRIVVQCAAELILPGLFMPQVVV